MTIDIYYIISYIIVKPVGGKGEDYKCINIPEKIWKHLR